MCDSLGNILEDFSATSDLKKTTFHTEIRMTVHYATVMVFTFDASKKNTSWQAASSQQTSEQPNTEGAKNGSQLTIKNVDDTNNCQTSISVSLDPGA